MSNFKQDKLSSISHKPGHNFADEKIPDWNSFKNTDEKAFESLETAKKFQFDELFHIQEGSWYSQNTDIFQKMYNTKKKEETDKKNTEVTGLYIFYENDEPLYVGISRRLIQRLRHHFLSKSHFSSSLVYLMARDEFEMDTGELYKGERKNFTHFIENRERLQEMMRKNWKIQIIPETDNYKLYYWEIALACTLKTRWNTFITH